MVNFEGFVPKTHSEITSAADKSIGFDFQYYYFLLTLLDLEPGQRAGLEVLDDVHTELAVDRRVLVQLKHTVQFDDKGLAATLSELDGDLWKSLYNWAKTITDAAAGRGEIAAQKDFVAQTSFQLVTNKRLGPQNSLLKDLSDFHRDHSAFDEVLKKINQLHGKTENEEIKKYISAVLSMDLVVCEEFLKRVTFEFDVLSVHGLIRRAIRKKLFASDQRIEDVFVRLDSVIREDNYISVVKGRPIIISFEDFEKKYRNIFEDARGRQLPMHRFTPEMPDDLFGQLFIKQLIRIGDVSPDDGDSIVRYTEEKLILSNLLLKWLEEGHLVADEIEDFHEEAKARWLNAFRAAYRQAEKLDDAKLNDIALNILDSLRKETLNLIKEPLSTRLSNGELYGLSDRPEIGWHRDWKIECEGGK
ncbi:hypothetical protein J2W28_003058 [Variovorax boronicumulans]|uniref:ABC-three component system protein n=1 Tax=Variovorax boronicumulans TaxID=436515 RepID=UPI002783B60A|nr:ABC-three component system protein [Variovorax boronicumulans]MDP9991881.1 hypothetical protein [Variovorax boronicumulans]MDQ0003909.1 hypothetical protein [Variovorax boronicumulans]